MRCYRQALYVYNEKSWHLAEVCVLLLLAFLFFTSVFFSEETFTAAGLAQSVERLTAEREVAGSIPGAN